MKKIQKERNMLSKKALFKLAGLIVGLSMLLTACGGAAATTAAPITPATSAPATTAPVAVAPTSTTGAAPAAAGGWCSNVKIVFFPGGTPGGGFEQVVYNGAVQAAKDTGADVQYVWSDWDPSKMTTQFQQAVATKPDGIAIMGHPGDIAFDPLIDAAEAQGILVTSMNVQLPLMQAKYAANGFGYSGAIQYTAGYALGQEAVKESGLKAGDTAFLWGLKAQAGRGQRTIGVQDALEKAGLKVVYQEIDTATNANASAGVPVFAGIMSAHPEIKMVITDHGNLTGTIQTFLQAAGKKPGDVFAAGFDVSGNAVTAIQGGWLQLVSDQQQYLQGYFGVLQLCLAKVYHFSGLQIDTGAGFVTKSNLDALTPLIKAQIR
jgi:simple sugar transport system substrate-binding protein